MTRVTFTFAVPPPSKKNGMVQVPGRRGAVPSTKVLRAAEQARLLFLQAAAAAGAPTREPLWPEQDVAVRVTHRIGTDSVSFAFEALGDAKEVRGRTGRKRDLDNLTDAVFDALQGLAYGNDNQIALIIKERLP